MWKWFAGLALTFLNSIGFAQSISENNELLWEISGNGLKQKSYLYGTFHSNDKRVFRFSDSVYFALNHAKAIVLETDLFSLFDEMDTRQGEVKMLYDNQGNPYTSTNKASKTVYGSEDGMPQFLDAYFQQYCYNAGKSFFPLESVDDQLDLISDWGMVESSSEQFYSLTAVSQEQMMEYYLKGDITTLDKMMKANLAIYKGMYDDLIVNRNKIMANGIDTLLRKNSLLCAVGAGHLAGEQGIINLLRKKGYHLRKVTASYSVNPTTDKQDVASKKNYTYTNDTIGVVAVFPGKPLEVRVYDNHPFLIYREMGQGNTYSVEIVPLSDDTSLEEQALIYIASPDQTSYKHTVQDDGTEIYQGLSDTYPEGLHWVRLLQSDRYLLILKAYGGNKFMNSNRPDAFFSHVWFE